MELLVAAFVGVLVVEDLAFPGPFFDWADVICAVDVVVFDCCAEEEAVEVVVVVVKKGSEDEDEASPIDVGWLYTG